MHMHYRIGRPGWRLARRLGARLQFNVDVWHDKEADVYIATSDDIQGLVVEAKTLDELKQEVFSAASSLLQISGDLPARRAQAVIRFPDTTLMAA